MDIPLHPVRVVWDEIQKHLKDFQTLQGSETQPPDFHATSRVIRPDEYGEPHYLSTTEVLRQDTTATLWSQMSGHQPPVKLMTAGRVFRKTATDALHMPIFHQVDVIHIGQTADFAALKEHLEGLLKALLGDVGVAWADEEKKPFAENLSEVLVAVEDIYVEVAGACTIPAETLRVAKYDSLQGFAYGLGLDRLAMLKFGITDIRSLWNDPLLTWI